MKFCYVDESGAGSEPFLVMVAVVVDALRMHKTKEDWDELLSLLKGVCGEKLKEFHMSGFYSGDGHWHKIDGPVRAKLISSILSWWGERKHCITFTAVDKEIFKKMKSSGELFDGCSSAWQTAAIHITLSLQKAHRICSGNKGHTLMLFDEKVEEESPLIKFISDPPSWTDSYYNKKADEEQLGQIIDVPYFGNSKNVLLLQVADLIAFVLRRHIEVSEGRSSYAYKDEQARLEEWLGLISNRCYPSSIRWPGKPNKVQEMFVKLAPLSIRKLCK